MSADPELSIVEHCPKWRHSVPKFEAICRKAAETAWRAGGGESFHAEVAVVLSDDREVQKLNAQYRGLDRPTNVLSFAYLEANPSAAHPSNGAATPLGDIIVAFETSNLEAETEGRPLSEHLCRLVVHGMLHLLGYDHGTESEALEMEQLEARTLALVGVSDPEVPLITAKDGFVVRR